MSEVIMYHATFTDVAEIIRGGEDLYGWYDPKNLKDSGNLTDHPGLADLFTVFPDRNTLVTPDSSPVVLIFKLQSKQLYRLGKVPGYGGDAYATNLIVPIENVPEGYLIRTGFSREFAQQRGFIFYRVPSNALIKVEEG